MFNFFKKKPVTEESVTWSPPDTTDVSDEIKLCSNCQFKGKCQFRFGCKTFKQIRSKRSDQIESIRGFRDKNPENDSRPTYLTSLSWRERVDYAHHASIKIISINGCTADVSIYIRPDQNGNTNVRQFSISIDIPMTCNEYGRQVANIQQLRAEVRKEVLKLGR